MPDPGWPLRDLARKSCRQTNPRGVVRLNVDTLTSRIPKRAKYVQ